MLKGLRGSDTFSGEANHPKLFCLPSETKNVEKVVSPVTMAETLPSVCGPRGYKTFFVLNSAEQEISPANKSQITNNRKYFLAKHS